MSVYKVNVKWGKQKLEKLELDTNETPAVFKSQLFSLTGVPLERQKLMVGGLKVGDENWNNVKLKLKNNMTFMLMGSAASLPEAPKERIKFIEDMTESEAAAALLMPIGIENFGNTCYMNATLQCLKAVPELVSALSRYRTPGSSSDLFSEATGVSHASGTPQALTKDLNVLYLLMEAGQEVRLPAMLFLQTLHTIVPEFAQKDEKTGRYRQQDAHECWSVIVNSLSQTLKLPPAATPTSADDQAAVSRIGFMKQYFGVQIESTYKCEESPEEPVTMETEDNYQVSCFISQDVKYMHTALRKGLESSVEKTSPLLGRDAVYKKTSCINRLPAYLTVQFVRFFVGKAPDTEEMVSKKILKDVKYTMKLDMYEFCSSELQKKLTPMRSKFKELEEKKMALKAKMIAEGKLLGPKQATAAVADAEKKDIEYEPFEFEDDMGSNNSGYYDLVAVLTHKGRSSSSGHYVGWVALKNGDWAKLDDDRVSIVKEDQILKLSGGGDWHVAYILLYAPRRLEVFREEEEEEEGEKSEGGSEETTADAAPMETDSTPPTDS